MGRDDGASETPEILTEAQLLEVWKVLKAVSGSLGTDDTEVVFTRREALALYNSLVLARHVLGSREWVEQRGHGDVYEFCAYGCHGEKADGHEPGCRWVLAMGR
jgi:hypothetical protein